MKESSDIRFCDLIDASFELKKMAARILFDASRAVSPEAWATFREAVKEVEDCCREDFICIGVMVENQMVGWAGMRPMYGNITWELHPMMIKPDTQKKGIGTMLLNKLENIAREKGILNIILGTDDEMNLTSLSGKDLYDMDLFEEIKNIKNLGNHPFEFYQENGYSIIGVVPDANGPGKPDILMGKRLDS